MNLLCATQTLAPLGALSAQKLTAHACQSMGRGAMALPGWSNVCWCGSNRSAYRGTSLRRKRIPLEGPTAGLSLWPYNGSREGGVFS